jgi:signal peptidase I
MMEWDALSVQEETLQPAEEPILTDVPRPKIRQQRKFMREMLETILLIASIYAFVNLATARFVVDGHSMLPNFNTDQFIIVSRLSYILGSPQRGDVVVFHYPMQYERDFIKRVIGLPGETVTILEGHVYINGQLLDEPYIENFCFGKSCDGEWVVGPDQYFVLGDNRGASKDSQDFGPVDKKYMVGRAFLRYWPPADWGVIARPSYNGQGAPLPTMTATPSLPTPTFSVPLYPGQIPNTPVATPTNSPPDNWYNYPPY